MEINRPIKQLSCLLLLLISIPSIAEDNFFYQNNEKIKLTPITPLIRSSFPDNNAQTTEYYTTEQGQKVGIYNKILVKFKPEQDIDPQLLLAPYDVSIEKSLGNLLYLLVVPTNDLTLGIANRLAEQDFIEYAHPDFIKQRRVR